MPPIPRIKPKPPQPEAQIQHAIRKRLGDEPDLMLFRNAQVFAEIWDEKSDDVRRVRAGLGKGTPDLLGILAPHGRAFFLEVKTAEKNLTPLQREVAETLRRHGAFVARARCVEEALDALARARAGASE